jgi:hypothetical protein
MAAIRHKLSARPSSGTPSAFSTRGGVELLKTFASIRPSRIRSPVLGGVARYQGKKLASMAAQRVAKFRQVVPSEPASKPTGWRFGHDAPALLRCVVASAGPPVA